MPNDRPLFLVDLDRTLLNTSAYTAELWKHAAGIIPGVDAAAETERGAKGEYYILLDPAHGQSAYSLETHIKDLLARRQENNDDKIVRMILQQLQSRFPDASAFLYDHYVELFDKLEKLGEVSIITFGVHFDQSAKLQRLLPLAQIPAIIIGETKGAYIANSFLPTKDIWLIDDKEYPELPTNCREVLIDHEGTKVSGNNVSLVVHDLRQAGELIASFYKAGTAT